MQTIDMIPILVPAELLQAAGIEPGCVVQWEVIDGKLVMQVADPNPEDFDCDGECDDCPFYDEDSDYCPIFDDFIDFNNSEGANDNE